MNRFETNEIKQRLRNKINSKKIIFGINTGLGMVAKKADEARVDFIITDKESIFAADGRIPAMARAGYGGDCNEVVLEAAPKILERVEKTPVIAGFGIAEPYTNVDRLTDKFLKIGFSGVTNIPTSGGWVGPYGDGIRDAGVGYSAELSYIEKCSKRGIFTIGYCFTEEQVKQMCAAGASVLSLYVPKTKNESHGWKAAESMDQALETAAKLCETARKENSEAIILCSGGTMESISDIKRCMETTKAHGFIGDEIISCAKIEDSIKKAVGAYKSLRLSVK